MNDKFVKLKIINYTYSVYLYYNCYTFRSHDSQYDTDGAIKYLNCVTKCGRPLLLDPPSLHVRMCPLLLASPLLRTSFMDDPLANQHLHGDTGMFSVYTKNAYFPSRLKVKLPRVIQETAT